MKRTRIMLALPFLLAAFVGAEVAAQPGKDKREEKREERKDKREEKREDRAEKREEAKDKREEKREDRAEKRKEWREKRQDRRKERRAELKEKWGDLVKKGPVKAELARHGRRMARLNRLSTLAEELGKDDLKKRVDELIAKEQTRHQNRMAKLKEKGGEE